MVFLYQNKFDEYKIQGCPCSTCHPTNYEVVYRISQNPVKEKSFLPVAELNKRRLKNLDPQVDSVEMCNLFGISLYLDIDSAKKCYQMFKDNFSKLDFKFLSKGKIDKLDGVCSLPDKNNHFNLHPFRASSALYEKFEVLESLK